MRIDKNIYFIQLWIKKEKKNNNIFRKRRSEERERKKSLLKFLQSTVQFVALTISSGGVDILPQYLAFSWKLIFTREWKSVKVERLLIEKSKTVKNERVTNNLHRKFPFIIADTFIIQYLIHFHEQLLCIIDQSGNGTVPVSLCTLMNCRKEYR